MKAGRIALGVMFVTIGPAHWVSRRFLSTIVPDYLPAHRGLVVASGAVATATGVALLVPQARRPAAWVAFAWLIAVYPANIWMVQVPERYKPIPEWLLWTRLPFQFPMLWWAWRYTRPEPAAAALQEPRV